MSDHALVLNENGALSWTAGLGKTTAAGKSWTETIAENIGGELARMQETLGEQADPKVFLAVEECARSTLWRIGELAFSIK